MTGPPGPCGCGCPLTPTTSHGFSVDQFAREVVGFEFLPWQRWLMIHGLELLPDGRYRFRTVLVLVARQNGKTAAIEIKNLWKMYVQGAQVLGTAQDLDVSEESWDNAVEMCEGIAELAAEIRDVVKVNGKKALKLSNGARWKVKAANRRGGRGFSGDDVNLDELREHQKWDSWSAVTKTTRARSRAQVWAFTNAGDDSSVVLNHVQSMARATVAKPLENPTVGLFEWSAPDDTECTCGRLGDDPHRATCALADVRLWAASNPALGYTIEHQTMRSDLNTDPNEVFLAECLCVRVKKLDAPIMPRALWQLARDEQSTVVGMVGLGVDAAPDLTSAAIGMAGIRADGKRHWQVLEHQKGTAWVVASLNDLKAGGLDFGPVGIDPISPAGALINDIRDAGFEVEEISGRTLVQAWGSLFMAVRDDQGRHIGQHTLDQAIQDAKTAPSGDNERFSRKRSSGDICPLVAVTLADHQLQTQESATPWVMFA